MADTQSPHTGEQVTEADRIARFIEELGGTFTVPERNCGHPMDLSELAKDVRAFARDHLTTAACQPKAMADQSTEARLREARQLFRDALRVAYEASDNAEPQPRAPLASDTPGEDAAARLIAARLTTAALQPEAPAQDTLRQALQAANNLSDPSSYQELGIIYACKRINEITRAALSLPVQDAGRPE